MHLESVSMSLGFSRGSIRQDSGFWRLSFSPCCVVLANLETRSQDYSCSGFHHFAYDTWTYALRACPVGVCVLSLKRPLI